LPQLNRSHSVTERVLHGQPSPLVRRPQQVLAPIAAAKASGAALSRERTPVSDVELDTVM
jgi:hypothetical protein